MTTPLRLLLGLQRPQSPRRAVAVLLVAASTSPVGTAVWAQNAPALPAPRALRSLPMAALPVAPPPVGMPRLASEVSCPLLQRQVAQVLGGEQSRWSVSVADGSGRLLADVNGRQPRVPASNQKLISTAFALDRLGPDYRLTTQLWRLQDGTLRMVGQGDPDLALPQLQRFAQLAMAAGTPVRLELAEEAPQNWWPSGWHTGDRAYAYGAPITRLAVTSNAIDDAVSNPASRLQTLLRRSMARNGGPQVQLALVSARQPLPSDAVLVHEEPSTSMHGLLSLANTESHNFTAEVLLRQAADTWDLAEASRRTFLWLNDQGLPMEGVRIADGSGLDRANRVTSRFLVALLLRMDHHPYSRDYVSSMAIAGRRGTLRNLYKGTSLDGQFFAKTGTLTGVRSISGILQTTDGPRYVSAVSAGAGAPNTTIGRVLRQVQTVGACQPAF
ncbi:D-alanyl-D-alanine carboxypeptidase/D-alanyl-D-alanine-endopeptidase [Cyanobium gracile]|uniref:D-alanyl-D-alanine carboxypeptidase n=1 Tax=Cyanobium gracile UHCC 0281 TaxID=3110309 RepID=A0ABU5SXG3_9CYAN|nr:D-alanyl-D-alanine carboxypeptidase [Cyanobium gracile]MEA5443103.1 D-alanyl-D-alanine carboxypeptidase [Cyanobium gracile UHCC 0281]